MAAHSSINALSVIFPGSSEASFSLAAFIDLVRREWYQHERDPQRPARHYGITKVAWALVGWVSLQGVTQEWQEKRWLKHLREVEMKDMPHKSKKLSLPRKPSRVRVTSDVIFSGEGGAQIITANIGEDSPESERIYLRRTRSRASMRSSAFSLSSFAPTYEDSELEDLLPIPEIKANLRRYSKLVLAGYGGASLLFFGVSPMQRYPTSTPQESSSATSTATQQDEKTAEEAKLATAIDASEAEAAGENTSTSAATIPEGDIFQQYSWWDILLGKHDQEIFENTLAAHPSQPSNSKKSSSSKSKIKIPTIGNVNLKSRAVIGDQHLMPRFWVLTDYLRQEVVLVIRGTMSLNEIAADLTCESEWFEPAKSPPPSEVPPLPGQFKFPTSKPAAGDKRIKYHVHGGMLKLAKAMGDVGKPVQVAVMEALYANPDFDLVLCGHSLGAGVAALLGMIWADPETCLTVPSSGLPIGRHVQVYCFAPPALTDASLSRLVDKLIISFVYSNDVVSRLSLGSVRDIRNAAMWLCDANEAQDGKDTREGYTAVTSRARNWKAGSGSPNDMDWFISVRKTLQANMQNCDMYPPGRVFWALRDRDFHTSHQRYQDYAKAKLRLFEVLNVKEVFSQIVFAQNMLSSHMPHQYDKVLHELV
ncbi:hypothetical protein MD484_g2163, partial [Candolleomyces efflorescens]